jgi:hypothetical protein
MSFMQFPESVAILCPWHSLFPMKLFPSTKFPNPPVTDLHESRNVSGILIGSAIASYESPKSIGIPCSVAQLES